jgi:hypothetical protein
MGVAYELYCSLQGVTSFKHVVSDVDGYVGSGSVPEAAIASFGLTAKVLMSLS